MKSRLAAGKLQDVDDAFAINDVLDAAFQVVERIGVDFSASADWRIGVTGRAGKIAGVDDFNKSDAGGKFFEC